MNIKELRYYHDLVIQKNFSKVATHFGVAQPTITMAIQRLERELGAPLFIRSQSHHDLTVTASGLQFDQHVQTILRELEVAHQELSRAKQERIRFGLPPIIGNYFFPAYTPALLAAGLLQRLEVEGHGSRELTKMLAHGIIDMALLGSLAPLQQDSFSTQVITRAPIQIIVAPDHPLATRTTGVSFQDLKKEPFITLANEYVHAQAFHQVSQAAGVRPKVVFKTHDVHVLKTLVAKNSGISFLTTLALEPQDHLVALPLLDLGAPEFIISVATRANRLLSPYGQELWGLLADEHD
ncbi:LysR family transcriptional regulator [Limosilactobacillus fermentum]